MHNKEGFLKPPGFAVQGVNYDVDVNPIVLFALSKSIDI